jgi:hypothetical protein
MGSAYAARQAGFRIATALEATTRQADERISERVPDCYAIKKAANPASREQR